MGFFAGLEARARAVGSILCVGLDPHPQDLAAPSPEAARDFCLRLIEATAEVAAAFKPNTAFFEVFGAGGLAVLKEVIAAVPDGIPVILDAKRGDIASTAEAYARAVFETLGAGAVTASPYLGRDSLAPFLRDPERGVFLLCKTSNPGAADFQDLLVQDPASSQTWRLYEIIARRAQGWNTADNLGLVIGATQLEALARVRELAPELWFLAPGVGAQGGDLASALAAGLRSDGFGLLVPVSRALSRAAHPRAAAEALREEIARAGRQNSRRANNADAAAKGPPAPAGRSLEAEPASPAGPEAAERAALADGLLAAGCVKFGQFTLKSGLVSPIYVDLRRLTGFPRLLAQVASAYLPLLHKLQFDRLAALPYAALPIGTAISLAGDWSLVYPRKEAKAYGTRAEVEGVFNAGERVVVIDDLTTTGGSKFEAIEKLTAAGLQVRDVAVLIDRQSGAAEALAARGVQLHAVFTLTQLLDGWQANGRVPADQISAARKFLAAGV